MSGARGWQAPRALWGALGAVLLSAALAAVLLSACKGPEQSIVREPSRPTRPDWVMSPPREADALLVVGVKTGARTLEEGKKEALLHAMEQAASFIEARVRSEFEAVSTTETPADRAEETIRVTAAARVRDLAVVDEYSERTQRMIGSYFEESFDVYVLARLPVVVAAEERVRLGEDARANAKRALELWRAAERRRAPAELGRARAELQEARRLLEGLDASIALSAEAGPEGAVPDVGHLRSRVAASLEGMEARARSVTFSREAGVDPEAARRIETEMAGILAERGIEVRPDGRFRLQLSLRARGSGQVFGQDVVRVSARVAWSDLWMDGAQVGVFEAEEKGFGGGPPAATLNAARAVGHALGREVAEKLEARLKAP